jgi:hypothetical protein
VKTSMPRGMVSMLSAGLLAVGCGDATETPDPGDTASVSPVAVSPVAVSPVAVSNTDDSNTDDGVLGEGEPATSSGAAMPPFEEFRVTFTGSPFAPTPPGSPCHQFGHDNSFVLQRASRTFSWDRCWNGGVPDGALVLQQGSRVLSADEFDAVALDYARMVPQPGPSCGSDAPFYTLDVRTSTGDKRYDDVYQCFPRQTDGRGHVLGLWEFSETLERRME